MKMWESVVLEWMNEWKEVQFYWKEVNQKQVDYSLIFIILTSVSDRV